MDALSSQATVSGYRAGLSAAEHLAKFFPMFMTAAGTVPPAKVLVMGVGVAGLQAIATARRLGAVVKAYDVRAAAKEEAESLGATFVELDLETQEGAGGYAREQSAEDLAKQQRAAGRRGGGLRRRHHHGRDARAQGPGAGDHGHGRGDGRGRGHRRHGGGLRRELRADRGRRGRRPPRGHVVGLANPPSAMPTHASFLYARNMANLLGLLVTDGELAPDLDDEIVAGMCVLRAGRVVHGPTAEALGLTVAAADPPTAEPPAAAPPASDQETES